MPGLITDANAA